MFPRTYRRGGGSYPSIGRSPSRGQLAREPMAALPCPKERFFNLRLLRIPPAVFAVERSSSLVRCIKDSSSSVCRANFHKISRIRARIGIQHNQIRLHPHRNAPALLPLPKSRRRRRRQRRQNLHRRQPPPSASAHIPGRDSNHPGSPHPSRTESAARTLVARHFIQNFLNI
jgi:hypothetical protein